MERDAAYYRYAPKNNINGLLPIYNDYVCYLIRIKMIRLESDDLAF